MRLWSLVAEPKQLIAAGGAIFTADILARLVLWLLRPHEQTDVLFGLGVYGVVLVVVVAISVTWTRRYVASWVAARLALAGFPSAIVIGVVGPLASGDAIGQGGVTVTMFRVLLTMAVMTAGAVVGVLSAVALGQDPTSRAWRAQAEQVLAKRRAAK